MHSKSFASRFDKTIYNLEWSSIFVFMSRFSPDGSLGLGGMLVATALQKPGKFCSQAARMDEQVKKEKEFSGLVIYCTSSGTFRKKETEDFFCLYKDILIRESCWCATPSYGTDTRPGKTTVARRSLENLSRRTAACQFKVDQQFSACLERLPGENSESTIELKDLPVMHGCVHSSH